MAAVSTLSRAATICISLCTYAHAAQMHVTANGEVGEVVAGGAVPMRDGLNFEHMAIVGNEYDNSYSYGEGYNELGAVSADAYDSYGYDGYGYDSELGASEAGYDATSYYYLGASAETYPTPPSTPGMPDKFCINGTDSLYCPEFPLPSYNGSYPDEYTHSGTFPDGFIWGLGTAAYQIEGAYNEGGRGASIWDTFTGANTVGMPGSVCESAPCPVNKAMKHKGATGNVACNHYHDFKEHVALMVKMGLKNYRFSISWPRVVPTGNVEDGVNEVALKFYENLVDELVAVGITPYVTLYHWDLPQGLLQPGNGTYGWYSVKEDGTTPSGQMTEHFVAFSRKVFERIGKDVKVWITFNEAWTFTWLAGGYGKAPGLDQYSKDDKLPNNMQKWAYVAMHNVLLAHAAVVHMYRKEFKPTQYGRIGITNNCDWREPKTHSSEDIAAADRAVLFQLGWASEPIYGKDGDYPPLMRKFVGDLLPTFTDEQKALLKGSADFFGLNHYGTGWASFAGEDHPGDDRSYAKVTENGFAQAQSAWLYGSGWGVRKILNWIRNRYDSPQIYVTEAGWSLAAKNAKEGREDPQRVQYYANYTAGILNAIKEDGVNVGGFFAWSLMDNFEWEMGYAERFGLVFDDFGGFGTDDNSPMDKAHQPVTNPKQILTRKDSSCWLQAVSEKNGLVDPTSVSCKTYE